MIRALLPPGLLLLIMMATVRAGLMNELSSSDQAKVKAGDQVMLTETLEGYPWPRVTVYQKSDASPREVMAVFSDYNGACHYVPNCLKSRIAKKIDPLTFDVDYVIDVPILPDEAYTVRNSLAMQSEDGIKVQWRVLKATSIEESIGNLVVEPLGSGSILRYTNLVKPSSRAATLLRSMAMSQMKETVQALVDEVGKRANTEGLKDSLDRLNAALGPVRK